jgi:hypothetical protein
MSLSLLASSLVNEACAAAVCVRGIQVVGPISRRTSGNRISKRLVIEYLVIEYLRSSAPYPDARLVIEYLSSK